MDVHFIAPWTRAHLILLRPARAASWRWPTGWPQLASFEAGEAASRVPHCTPIVATGRCCGT
eukprot:4773321-Prymnesium_polylepis.1